ncbi:hypothetical protein N865_10390 [Intrasporangium oryzae NRRL B-24470]|uniref:Integral membrane protein n=1 Tax=Intrasporangium oryzae NRRL B-24470 TaxID=1386089 RepID=W9GC76_9MICO|nr:hypothetical protein N865_10390 [Intrasporangium oryzae NRRL B-24470]
MISALLVPVAIVAIWASVMLTRTDVFVDEMSPVLTKPEVQQALTDGVTRGVLDRLALGPAIESAVAQPLGTAVAGLVASPQVETAWTRALGAAHRQLVATLQGSDTALVDDQGRLVLSVAVPIPAAVSSVLSALGVAVPDSLQPTVTVPLLTADDLAKARTAYRTIDAARLWAPLGALALGAICIALARRHRRAVVRLAVGWGLAALALGLALLTLRGPAVASVTDPIAHALADEASGVAVTQMIWGIGAVLALVVITMLVAGLTRGREKEMS